MTIGSRAARAAASVCVMLAIGARRAIVGRLAGVCQELEGRDRLHDIVFAHLEIVRSKRAHGPSAAVDDGGIDSDGGRAAADGCGGCWSCGEVAACGSRHSKRAAVPNATRAWSM
jgi:hypothetical protein